MVRVEEEAFPASFGCHGVGAQLGVSRIRKEGGQVAPVVVWEVLLPVREQNVSLPVLAVITLIAEKWSGPGKHRAASALGKSQGRLC